MKKKSLIIAGCLLIACALMAPFIVGADDRFLEGDEKDACEALMCLSSSHRPSECEPSLRRYFSIVDKKPWKTMQKRRDFLKMCPETNGDDSQMGTLANVIVEGAGRCDATALNQSQKHMVSEGGLKFHNEISNTMPAYCVDYFNHTYTDFEEQPMYVGTPEEDGFWTEAGNYDSALEEYNRKQEEKKEYQRLHPLG